MRIRSVKPEFFDSPSTATCTPWARLLYIAMWCMADDWGVGSANPKEMAANAFPNDDQWTGKELPSLCKEVADAFGVVFYTHRGRRYFQIPSWDDHQVTQRRAKRRFPTWDDPESAPDQEVSELPSIRKELPSRSKENASTEQGKGNRGKGTGEQEQGRGEQANGRKRPAHPLPDDWTPKDSHREKAVKDRINLNLEAEKFRDNALAKDLRYVNWDRAFNTWLSKDWVSRIEQPQSSFWNEAHSR